MQGEVNVETPSVYSSGGAWWELIVDVTIDYHLNKYAADLQLDAVRDFETQGEQSDFESEGEQSLTHMRDRRFHAALVMTEIVLSFWEAEYAVYGPISRKLIRMIMAFENRLNFEHIYADKDGAPCARALRVALHTRGVNNVMLHIRMNMDCDKVFMLDVPDGVALATKVDAIWRLIANVRVEWQVTSEKTTMQFVHAFDKMIEHIIPPATTENGSDIRYLLVHIFDMIDALNDFRNGGSFYSTVLGYALIGTWERRKKLAHASPALIDSIDKMVWERCAEIPALKIFWTSLIIDDVD